jgi:hypothetical protein
MEPKGRHMVEDFDLRGWLDVMEAISLRSGNLRKRWETNTERVIRMKSNLEQDKILLETQDCWNIANNMPDYPIWAEH